MRKRVTRAQAIRRWVVQVVAIMVVLVVTLVLAAAVVVPRLAGATPYTILTGSMTPGMPPGTLVVVKPVDPAEIHIGSVVTYQLRSGDPTVVTHRVVAQGIDADGDPVFQTQGDANDVADERWVRPVQVMGERWYDLPYVGHVSQLLDASQRHLAVQGIAAALVLYAVWMGVGAARDRRTRHERVPS